MVAPYELSQKLYGRLKEGDIFMGVSEACAHIDVLAEKGLIKETKVQAGEIRFQAVNDS